MKRSELKLKVKTFREKLETVSQSLPDDLAQFSVALYPLAWNPAPACRRCGSVQLSLRETWRHDRFQD